VKNRWVEPDLRDAVVGFVESLHTRTTVPRKNILSWASIRRTTYYDWRRRLGEPNRHNGHIPKEHHATSEEKAAVCTYARTQLHKGYRTLTYEMIDRDIAALSPSTVYRILSAAGLLGRAGAPTKKGTGFVQPLAAHEHWHTDFTYINIGGTFHFLCAVLDGYSRAILAWEIAPTMTSADAQRVLQKAREAHPGAKPRIISDNGSQFTAREFGSFLKTADYTHVTTSPYHPQSNGKIERFNLSYKHGCIYPLTPLTLEDARRITGDYIEHYNNERLHSAVGYITPANMLGGRQKEIHDSRDIKLAAAREKRVKTNNTTNASTPLAA